LNFTEPYLYDTDWTAGVDAFQTLRTTQEYSEKKVGGALRLGHPLAPFLRGYARYKLDHTTIVLDPTYGDPDLYPVPTDANPNPLGNPNGYTSSGTLTLEYDKRDDRFAPTNGLYSSASLEYAGLGGDKHYTKGYFTGRFYKKTIWDIVWRNNLTYGIIRSNKPGEDPPYNELFLLGGANTLRGYDWYTVGKRKLSKLRLACLTSTDPAVTPTCPTGGQSMNSTIAGYKAQLPFGGQQQLIYQTEFEFPLISEAAVKGVVFYDIGFADDVLELKNLRSDWGFGFRWFSPIGPLRFEWGFPINRQTLLDESAVNFQFAIGSPF
jgi:outer membrane protein insertion porin family